jgi:hypothetical protein
MQAPLEHDLDLVTKMNYKQANTGDLGKGFVSRPWDVARERFAMT